MQKTLHIGYGDVEKVTIGRDQPLTFILGPCAIESLDHALFMAENIATICQRVGCKWIYKSCFDKDCRSSIDSFNGVGIEDGLKILAEVRSQFKVPVVSDFSEAELGQQTGEICDLVQVPAYLCRQTSILRGAALTGRPVHLKKGQFMSPWNMKNSVRKLENFGCNDILLTDRGTFFGYNMLVNDFTSLPIMSKTGYPVCYDATHSIQMPTSMGTFSGGQREFILPLVRAAAGCGVSCIFMEVHDDPNNALSDPSTQLDIKFLETIAIQAKEIHAHTRKLLSQFGEDDSHGFY